MDGVNEEQQVFFMIKGLSFFRQADSRRDFALTVSLINDGREQEGLHATFVVIVTRLKEYGTLARVHCRVVEVEFGHDGLGSSGFSHL